MGIIKKLSKLGVHYVTMYISRTLAPKDVPSSWSPGEEQFFVKVVYIVFHVLHTPCMPLPFIKVADFNLLYSSHDVDFLEVDSEALVRRWSIWFCWWFVCGEWAGQNIHRSILLLDRLFHRLFLFVVSFDLICVEWSFFLEGFWQGQFLTVLGILLVVRVDLLLLC